MTPRRARHSAEECCSKCEQCLAWAWSQDLSRWDYKLHSFPHVPKGRQPSCATWAAAKGSGSFTTKTSKSPISAMVVIGMKNGLPTAKSNNVG
eukprot:COSAG01_NODE_36081_length_522_cov_1.605201_1_plen_92_part_01